MLASTNSRMPVFIHISTLLAILLCSNAWAQRDTVFPPRQYYSGFPHLYDGDYQTALETFRLAGRSGMRSTEGLWVDSICYYTMMGECLYRMGQNAAALEQFNSALKLAVFHSNWLLRVEFPEMVEPSASSVQRTINWGTSKRNMPLARVPDRMLSLQGRADNEQVLKQGGIVAPQEFYALNVKEIARCTAVAIRRRREIMGPVCQHHPFTNQLVSTFSRRATRPNHWSMAWMACYMGLAYDSAGKSQQAVAELSKSLLLAGQYDHELTGLAMVELGRLAFQQEQYQAAAAYYLEATFVAAAFDQFEVMEEGFRGAMATHLVSGQKTLYPPLVPAAGWSRRYSRALQAQLLLLAAENCTALGQTPQAVRFLAQTSSTIGNREMRSGPTAARFNYQSALASFSSGKASDGNADFSRAMAVQKNCSLRLYQIGLGDAMYTSGAVTQRVADQLFGEVLREPTADDWSADPMETLTVAITPHPLPMQHWFDIAIQRKDYEKAIEISDRIRRHRFYSTLPMGGRLLALRWILEAPESVLNQKATLQRQDLLTRYPAYTKLSQQAAAVRRKLQDLPLNPEEQKVVQEQRELLEQLAACSTHQEVILREVALRREPSELVFPAIRSVEEIQQGMSDGQIILSYLINGRSLIGFSITKETYSAWQIESAEDVGSTISELLTQIGMHERKPAVDIETLEDTEWKATAARLLDELTNNSKPEMWAPYDELIVVPDGPLWYLPFEALQMARGESTRPLIAKLPVRYVPLVSLANGDRRRQRPQPRTAVVVGKMTLGGDGVPETDAADDIGRVAQNVSALNTLPGPSNLLVSSCDRLVVLADLEQRSRSVYDWAPMCLDRGKAGSTMEAWFALPWQRPLEIILPGFRTAAATGLKRGGTGDDVFLAACGLMATGAKSALLSRWPVGGQSTFDLMREFIQELPYIPAASAWRRGVQLTAGSVLDPELEPRVNAAGLKKGMRTNHPFFWAGYVLVDTGSDPNAGDEP